MNYFEFLRSFGYEYQNLEKSDGLSRLTLTNRGEHPGLELLGGEFGIVDNIVLDLGSFIADRVMPVSKVGAIVVEPMESGEFRCAVGLVERNPVKKDRPDTFTPAIVETSQAGRRIDIILGSEIIPHLPVVQSSPASRQMQGLLDDYSRLFRVRKPGREPWA